MNIISNARFENGFCKKVIFIVLQILIIATLVACSPDVPNKVRERFETDYPRASDDVIWIKDGNFGTLFFIKKNFTINLQGIVQRAHWWMLNSKLIINANQGLKY